MNACMNPKYWGDVCLKCRFYRSAHIFPSFYEREFMRIVMETGRSECEEVTTTDASTEIKER